MIHEVKKGAELMTDKVLRDASGLTEEEFLAQYDSDKYPNY